METLNRAWIALWQGQKPSLRDMLLGGIKLFAAINLIHVLAWLALGLTP